FIIMQLLFGILVISQFGSVQAHARDSERKADMRLIESKALEYAAYRGYYPASINEITDIPTETLKGPELGETYVYEALPSGCTALAHDCNGYVISSNNMEKQSNPYTISSPTYSAR
ncbi:hypothetical protein KDA11_07035, partial [Candidatus Saccharibacteria bacterium]|nr:hypothetical protein [Candidatus Saccharibacteria bacterium]